jgi:tRNA-2-methylthio-N6-dimethylallyladenosine synthase
VSRSRRFFVETWGCQMNELDSQRLAGSLMQQGLLPAARAEDADVILLNSCSVRERAEQKVYSRLGEYRRLKAARPDRILGLCGCVAQQVGEQALRKVPELDFVLGPARVGELVEVLERRRAGERVVATGFPEQRSYELDRLTRDGDFKGMVTVIEGCDKRCTFCIVPSTRGPERCRPLADILAEVRHLLERGYLEIELLGQTVNHWRDPGGGRDFADLLDAVAALPGVARLRFVTSYPRDFTPRMIASFARHDNVCDYLHLPVQSGSDRVLRRMGRGYGVADYLTLVDAVRTARPAVALSTDLIVGFPGETDEDFEATVELLRRVRFSALYAFCFSPRPGTAATRLDGAVAPAVAAARLRRLNEVHNVIVAEQHRELVGREMEVLVTGWGREPGILSGRTSCHRIVHFTAQRVAPRLGTLVRARVVGSMGHSLMGEIVEPGGVLPRSLSPAIAAQRTARLPVVPA